MADRGATARPEVGNGAPVPTPVTDARTGPLGPTPADAKDERALWRRGRLLLVGLVALLGCVALLGALASAVVQQEAAALDAAANPFMHGLASPPLDALMNAASAVGTDWVLLPLALVTAAALASRGHRREALFLGAALGGSIIVNAAMKLVIHRPRPVLPWASVLPDYSFPSGHSMNSLAFGLALAFVVWRLLGRRAGIAALAIAVLASLTIGLSRIYLGYHYVTDVVGGFTAAILWVAVVVAVFRPRQAGERGLRRTARRP